MNLNLKGEPRLGEYQAPKIKQHFMQEGSHASILPQFSNGKGFIFDLNGTMIDDMHFHAKAWHQILTEDLNKALTWEEVQAQMYGKNSEVLERIFGQGYFTEAEMTDLSIEKERRYQKEYFQHLKLIDGLDLFLQEAAAANIPMAIGSAAIPFNIDFVLDNLAIRNYFQAVVSADDVRFSKPHPETFIKAAQQLGIAPPDCIVFEDAPKGVEAAQEAGMPCVVLTTMHGPEEFQRYSNILHFIPNYISLSIPSLLTKENQVT